MATLKKINSIVENLNEKWNKSGIIFSVSENENSVKVTATLNGKDTGLFIGGHPNYVAKQLSDSNVKEFVEKTLRTQSQ